MMDQLGIKALRPGVVNDVKSPANPVNYDEAKANPYPDYPDPLTFADGSKVTTADEWRNKRRPELALLFEREIYGRIPVTAPKVTWTVETVDNEFLGFTPITATKLIAHVDNSNDPAITDDFPMMLIKPAQAKGPMPVLIMFQIFPVSFPAPAQPSPEEFAKINEAWKSILIKKDPSLAAVFKAHPAYQPFAAPPFSFPPLDKAGDPPALIN